MTKEKTDAICFALVMIWCFVIMESGQRKAFYKWIREFFRGKGKA